MREWVLFFAWRFRRHFFRHTDFLRFKILRKFFFVFNLDFGYHRKMYRLIPCTPILGLFFCCCFFIKSAKRMCICDYVKNCIGTCKNVFFGLKKGISGLEHWIAPKHAAQWNLENSFYFTSNPAGNYLFKVNNRNTRTSCEIRSCSSGIFIVNFEHISHHVLVFLLLTLNM